MVSVEHAAAARPARRHSRRSHPQTPRSEHVHSYSYGWCLAQSSSEHRQTPAGRSAPLLSPAGQPWRARMRRARATFWAVRPLPAQGAAAAAAAAAAPPLRWRS